jgi:SMC interacting uncharacterized protein involved in chromosome segregation
MASVDVMELAKAELKAINERSFEEFKHTIARGIRELQSKQRQIDDLKKEIVKIEEVMNTIRTQMQELKYEETPESILSPF